MRSVIAWFVIATLSLTVPVGPAHAGGTVGSKSGEEPTVSWSKRPPGQLKPQPVDRQRLTAEQAPNATKPIYNDDDRMDWGKIGTDRVRSRAMASVALMSVSEVRSMPQGRTKTDALELGQSMNLCDDERFAKQITASFCSGTLVKPDLVATAGHCVREVSQDPETPAAKDILFVFGYRADNKDHRGRDTFEAREVYRGKEVVDGALKAQGGDDWAVVRLDRPVPRAIAEPVGQFRKLAIPMETDVYVIGYPSRLPLKYAGDAKVVENSARAFFTANLDTFGGNSGSGVFDAKTHEMVGILVRGEQDYYIDETDETKECVRAYRCREDCAGEDVTRMEIVKIP